ncbi:MAG TPA: nucleoside triphosphate pyrophosphohydrolase [Thermoanaerobaculia bacterium]|nr:nucleoside triphosphate pyrophosphohydrolase [Thermoanaerobaculia bacterium]
MQEEQEPIRTDLDRLIHLVHRLRAPDGCPWDRAQELEDVRAYLIEEAHETAAALDDGDWDEIGAELGDLLFQVAFLLELGREAGRLEPGAVIDGIEAKMVKRHPHVFGEERLETASQVAARWERRKLAEDGSEGALSGVPRSLPALVAAYRMGQKASGIGFDWPQVQEVLSKLDEEVEELKEALARDSAGRKEELRDELGDVLFTVANVARHLEIDPESALAASNRKFKRRFQAVERTLAEEGEDLSQVPAERLEELWRTVKDGERGDGG